MDDKPTTEVIRTEVTSFEQSVEAAFNLIEGVLSHDAITNELNGMVLTPIEQIETIVQGHTRSISHSFMNHLKPE